MVHFLSPEEYLFGTKEFENGSEQGGVYNRNIVSKYRRRNISIYSNSICKGFRARRRISTRKN